MNRIRFQRGMLLFMLIVSAVIASGMWLFVVEAWRENPDINTDSNTIIKLLGVLAISGITVALAGGFFALWQAEAKAHYRMMLDLQAEKHATEAKYRLLFENGIEAIILGDAGGKIFSANPSACKMLQRAGDELRALGWKSLLDPADPASAVVLRLDEALPEFSGEVCMVRAGGKPFPVELYARLYPGDDGAQLVGLFFRDITDRKRVEQELRFSEARFRSIFENSTAGVALVNLDGHYQMVNPAFSKIFGYSAEELLKIDFFKITHPDDLEISRRVMQYVLDRKGEVVHYAKRYIHRDGHTVWTEVNSVLVHGPDGRPLHFITHINDITERKLAEDALRESEERFRSLYQNAAIGIYRTTPDGQILMINPAALRILGYGSYEELIRVNLESTNYHPSYPRSEFRERVEREGVITGMESCWMKRDGTPVYVRESARVIRGADGAVLYYDGTFEDISEQKRAEQEVQRRTEQLTALHLIDTSIVSNSGLPAILNTLLDHSLAQLKVDAAAVLLLNPANNTCQYSAGRGFRTPGIERRYPLTLVPPQPMASGEARFDNLDEAEDGAARQIPGEGFVFYCGIPLKGKEKAYGLLEVYRRTPFEPTQAWLDFLETLATQAVIGIENTRLIEDLQSMNVRLTRAYNDTLEGWSRALDLRDRETEGHSRRVIDMTLQIARAFGIMESEELYLQWGALLHDIGKIGIPDDILLKPSSLTDEEMTIMKRHPEIAYQMLASIDFLLPAIDIPYCHHEKWDGTGYPRRLKGEQIPLAARIFAIADVWDALRSDRPYRKGWPEEKARQYIQDQKGLHFDPRVVDAFDQLMDHSQ